MAWHPRPQAKCGTCPANATAKSFAPSRGRRDAPLLLLDSGQDEISAALGSPLMGDNGRTLGTWLRLAGIDQRDCYTSSVAWCWPGDKRDPTRAEVEHCREVHWGAELQGRRVIVPIGVPAMRQFYAKAGESTAGQIIRLNDVGTGGGASAPTGSLASFATKTTVASPATYVVGLLHPSFILGGNFGLEPLQIQALKLVKRILDGWDPDIYDFTKPHVNANLYPTLAELRGWRAGFLPGDEVSLDVEAAGNVLTMIGLCRVRDLAHVTVWFRQAGGEPWPHEDWPSVVEWLYDLLADPSIGKVAHNHFYDWDQLESVGFEINGPIFDTLLASHVAFPELRKGLPFVSKMCGGPVGWKPLLKESEGDKK